MLPVVFAEELPVNLTVAVTVAVSPITAVAVEELKVIELDRIAACELGVVTIPRPKARTIPSEIRLKNVFVDIHFLSLVVYETFSHTAGRENISTS